MFRIAFVVAFAAAASLNVRDRYYTRTPSGYVLAHCNHQVAHNAHITYNPAGGLFVEEDGVTRHLPRCNNTLHGNFLPTLLPATMPGALPADYDGWLQYTAFNLSADQTFDSFLGRFSVPANPAQTPDQLFIFTGLQNKDWIPKYDPESEGAGFDIIQPVLQYPGDNGNYWSVKSWYVTLDVGTVASQERKCATGDYIFGNMTKTGPTTWFINSVVGSSKLQTSVTVNHPRLAAQPWAYNTLECYGCQNCATYPAGPAPGNQIQFTQLELTIGGKTVIPAWKANPKPNANLKCHESTTVADPQTVNIFFGTA